VPLARTRRPVQAIMTRMHRRALRLALRLLLVSFVAACPVMRPAHAADTQDKQAATEKKLAEVKQHLEKLAREQRAATGKRDSLQVRLARQSDRLAAAAKALRESEQALADNQHALDRLEEKRDERERHLDTQREALADLLRAAYRIRPGSDLRLLLGDADMARRARALSYSRYFQHDRMQRIHDLLGQLEQLRQERKDI